MLRNRLGTHCWSCRQLDAFAVVYWGVSVLPDMACVETNPLMMRW